MTKTNKTNKKTIGEMANSRMRWAFDPSTRIIKNKKEKVLTTGKKSNPIKDALFFILAYFFMVTVSFLKFHFSLLESIKLKLSLLWITNVSR